MRNFPLGTIFDLYPFQPKRILILPYDKGEITLYVMDAKAYVAPGRDPAGRACNMLNSVQFGGWSPVFKNEELAIPNNKLQTDIPGYPYCRMEAIFRLVPLAKRPRTAEVVALSFDECRTFYWNMLSKIGEDYVE